MSEALPSARITCDIGGTFTDVVVTDSSGRLTVAKALTQPAHLFGGLRAALERAAEQLQEGLSELLGRASLFIFSTTQATNAILEGTTARTAFLCTEGFPDILVRREGGSLRPYDYTREFADPYVPRRLTFEIPERIETDGSVRTPLDERAARAQLAQARALEVEAIAVCLLWSTANPAHELALGELIEQELPRRALLALTPDQPDRARVPPRLGYLDRRLAEAADADPPAGDRRTVSARRASAASCSPRARPGASCRCLS